MAVDDSMMPLSESAKIPQVYQLETKESNYDTEKNEVKICESKQLIGLTKEQLEQYRNDPFWKIVRCTMFALFWVAWILMFAGAILLIVFSPKCVLKKEPEWWRKQVSYQIFTPSFRDSNSDGIGDFTGIQEKLHDLRKSGIQTIWVTPVIATQKDDFIPLDVVDFANVDERFGTMSDLKSLIDEAHRLDMHFTMDLPISTTSVSHKWFKLAQKNDSFTDYYIWKKASDVKGDPNYVVGERKDYAYLTYEGKDPVLNWHNVAVRESVFEVAKNFLDMGVDGFHVVHISQLMKNQPTLQGHAALSALNEFVGALREYVNKNTTLNDREIAVFSTLDDLAELHDLDASEYGSSNLTYIIDNSVTKINNQSCPVGISNCLYSAIVASLEMFKTVELPHAWQFTDYHVSRLSTRFDKPTANLLTLIQLSLPDVVGLYYGQELSLEDTTDPANKFTGLMHWDSSKYAGFTAATEKPFFSTTDDYKENNFETQSHAPRSSLKTVKTVAKLRQHDANFVVGGIHLAPLIQDVILFGRFHQTNNATSGGAYVIAANFGSSDAEVNGTIVLPSDRLTAIAEIVAATPNVDRYSLRNRISLQNEKFILGPKQGIILKV